MEASILLGILGAGYFLELTHDYYMQVLLLYEKD